jgi:hypothetical protein
MHDTAERITKGHPIGFGTFGSVCTGKIEIRNLYAKNIMFACSLPTSTSTWRSDHRNVPGGYMSGELKSENIKYQKAPTRKSDHPAKRPTIVPSITTKPQKDISTLYSTIYTILETYQRPYNQDPTRTIRPSPIAVHTWTQLQPTISKRSLR